MAGATASVRRAPAWGELRHGTTGVSVSVYQRTGPLGPSFSLRMTGEPLLTRRMPGCDQAGMGYGGSIVAARKSVSFGAGATHGVPVGVGEGVGGGVSHGVGLGEGVRVGVDVGAGGGVGGSVGGGVGQEGRPGVGVYFVPPPPGVGVLRGGSHCAIDDGTGTSASRAAPSTRHSVGAESHRIT